MGVSAIAGFFAPLVFLATVGLAQGEPAGEVRRPRLDEADAARDLSLDLN